MGYNKEEIYSLLVQKISGYISVEDDAYIEKVIDEDEELRNVWLNIQKKHAAKGERFLNSLDEQVAWSKVKNAIPENVNSNIVLFNYKRWLSIAAIVILMITVSYYFFNREYSGKTNQSLMAVHEENTIELKLADGRSIPLNDNGSIDIGAVKLNMVDGKLNYQSDNSSLSWNTISVPLKMDYKLVLSDGTEVWINSASDLRFPFNFSGDTREVFLDGEAYFKVAKNIEKPFIVHVGGTDINVLGTSFNISSYNEKVITSLVEGSILNNAGNQSILLKPGYQSIFTPTTGFKQEEFEADHVLSWMEGIYYFEDIPLEAISDVLWRWFKVKLIVDNPKVHQLTFTGAIERDKPLDLFMQNLEITSGIKAILKDGELHLK